MYVETTGAIHVLAVSYGKREPGFVPPGPRRFGFEYWAANICNHDYFHQHYFRDDPAPIQMNCPLEGRFNILFLFSISSF